MSSPAVKRRALLGSAAAAALLLSGCGFALRRPPALAFQRLALVGFDAASPMAAALRRALDGSVELVDAPQQAQVVLEVLRERREQSVVAYTASGQVREVQLRVRFEYRVSTRGGRPLLAPVELLLWRDVSYSESIALAKMQEQAELYRDMEADVARQVLRRLETVPGA